MDNRWLQPVLERGLARVAAPGELWDRVQLPQQQQSKRPAMRLVWAMAAAGLVLAVLGLRGSRSPLELRSASPAEIQAWVKANSGLDVELAARPAVSVRLLGAHIIPGANPAVEVSYLAGSYEARLVVSKDPGASPLTVHDIAHPEWGMNGERYLLSCADPAGLQIACLLCHPGGAHDVTLN
ncbi:MAG TPA: hypothetical protein VMU80_23105 [Bryobacteraceae bacterium]|nr:hypothetical protein [Bryobacteraceae bacterium]HUO32127.1 hypothetical protein [Bryobacteraceae bacterium]